MKIRGRLIAVCPSAPHTQGGAVHRPRLSQESPREERGGPFPAAELQEGNACFVSGTACKDLRLSPNRPSPAPSVVLAAAGRPFPGPRSGQCRLCPQLVHWRRSMSAYTAFHTGLPSGLLGVSPRFRGPGSPTARTSPNRGSQAVQDLAGQGQPGRPGPRWTGAARPALGLARCGPDGEPPRRPPEVPLRRGECGHTVARASPK